VSEKLSKSGPDHYGYQEQRDFLFGLWAKLDLGNDVVLVIHDWGSALGFDWARQNPERVKGIVYMEAIVKTVTWQDWPENACKVFQGFRSQNGEQMVLEKNISVERVLPSSVLRGLTEDEMAVYRAPFAAPGEGRRPTLSWPRQLPIDGEPASVGASTTMAGGWPKVGSPSCSSMPSQARS
jgi:haloalkane dehalogenase